MLRGEKNCSFSFLLSQSLFWWSLSPLSIALHPSLFCSHFFYSFLASSFSIPHNFFHIPLVLEKLNYYLMMYKLTNENALFFYLQKDPINTQCAICIFSTFMCSTAFLPLSSLQVEEKIYFDSPDIWDNALHENLTSERIPTCASAILILGH